MMRVLLTAVAYLASLAVLAPVLFFLVLVLAGPHSSLLPSPLQPAVLIAGWVTVVLAPIAIALKVWRRRPS